MHSRFIVPGVQFLLAKMFIIVGETKTLCTIT